MVCLYDRNQLTRKIRLSPISVEVFGWNRSSLAVPLPPGETFTVVDIQA